MYRKLWRHRDLVLSLVRRQYQLRYRQSMVGFAWAILPPLATLGAANIVFHQVAGVQAPEGTNYSIITMAALVPWSFFQNSLTSGVPSVVQASSMLTRIPFPRASLPLSMIGISMLDLSIAALLFVVLTFLLGDGLPLTALWFPILLGLEVLLVAGVTLLTSSLNLFARDVKLAVPIAMQLWLFLTPVMYPLESVSESLRPYYLLNPMTGLVESFRTVLISPGAAPELDLLLPTIIGAVALFLLGSWYFAATENRFADVI